MSCAQCRGIEQQFNDAAVRRKLRQFRRRGPDKTTRLLIEGVHAALVDSGSDNVSLLDIGAGLGAIHHVLLDDLVSRAVHVEASPAQLDAAREETERRGHADQVEFIQGNFVDLAAAVPGADVVTLDRVICCFDDMHGLVSRAAEKAARVFGAVYPRDNTWMRIGVPAINMLERVKRSTFRVFLHDPRAIDAELRAAGLTRASVRRTVAWEVAVYRR